MVRKIQLLAFAGWCGGLGASGLSFRFGVPSRSRPINSIRATPPTPVRFRYRKVRRDVLKSIAILLHEHEFVGIEQNHAEVLQRLTWTEAGEQRERLCLFLF